MGKGRNRYGTGAGYIGRTTSRSARRTGTQASCTGDVVRKIDGHLSTDRQSSARRLARLRRNHRGLAAFASRVLDKQTGTSCNQTGRNLIGRTVKLNGRGNRAGEEYITYFQDLSMTVYNYISRMQVALLVLISTYVWNQGQANPMVGDTKPLPSKCRVNILRSYSIVACPGRYKRCRFLRPVRIDQQSLRERH